MGNYVKNVTYILLYGVDCVSNKPGHIIRLFQALT